MCIRQLMIVITLLLGMSVCSTGQDRDSLRQVRRDSLRQLRDSLPPFETEMALGARGSVLWTMVNFSPAVRQSLWMGYGGGLVFKYARQRGLGIQLELNYAPKGWKESSDDPLHSYQRRFHYLEMPFMTHIFLGKRTAFFALNVGPMFSYLIKDEERIGDQTAPRSYYQVPIANRVELGICAGIGILFKTKGGHIQVEGRYNHNFLNFFRNEIFNVSQNQAISASLAYLWAFNPDKKKTPKEPTPDPEKPTKEKKGTAPKVPKTKEKRTKQNDTTTPPTDDSKKRGGGSGGQ